MSKVISPYYPPRARWYAPLRKVLDAPRLAAAMDRIYIPSSVRWWGLLTSLVVPGLGFYLRGPRFLGKIAMAACACLLLIFIIWLGYPAGNYAIGLIISIHTSSFIYYLNPVLRDVSLVTRILFTVGVLILLMTFFYSPMRNFIQNHWLMPIQEGSRVIIVEKSATANQVHRGDRVGYLLNGYRFSNHYGNGIVNRTSLGLGPVLAVAGDQVQFSTNSFSVNGVSQPLLAHMPQAGSFSVSPDHWFIWPNLTISGNWEVGESDISSAMLQLANVSESQYVGKPLAYWFWRRQTLP